MTVEWGKRLPEAVAHDFGRVNETESESSLGSLDEGAIRSVLSNFCGVVEIVMGGNVVTCTQLRH